jgi:hypothetical protein
MVAQYVSRVTAHLRLLPHAEPCPPLDIPVYVWQASEGLSPANDIWEGGRAVRVRTLPGNHFEIIGRSNSQLIARELVSFGSGAL